jgi:hypothetical protein
MATKLSQNDIRWVEDEYFELNFNSKKNTIEGEIYFSRKYNDVEIEDKYSIKIDLNSGYILPRVFEISDKIMSTSKKYSVELSELHINPDKSFCLAIKPREHELFEKEFTIKEFFKNALEPFLFQMSFYDKYGKLPWGEYAHGNFGYYELYLEGKISLSKLEAYLGFNFKKDIVCRINRQSLCFCGSKKLFRKCHSNIFKLNQRVKIELC